MSKKLKKNKPNDFGGFDEPIAIFRVGEHTDSAGQKVTITADDLEQMVSNYQAGTHPYVIGHPKHDDPAYGWSAGFTVAGGTLYTASENVQPEFEEAVDSGLFRNRSVSIAKNNDDQWYVRHIGFLGAAAPAVKGLKKLEFTEDDSAITFEFAETDLMEATRSQGWAMRTLANLFRGVREDIIERLGVEAADKRIPAYELESINDAANKLLELPNDKLGHMYSHSNLQTHTEVPMFKKDDKSTATDDAATFTEADVLAREKAAVANAEKAAEAKFAHKQKCKDFAAKLEDDGKILPKDVKRVALFMQSQSSEIELTFSEGEGADAKDVKVSQFDEAQSIFSSLNDSYSHLKREQCREEDAPEGGGDQDAASLAKAANKFKASELAAGNTVSFSEALDHITAEAEQ